MKLVLGFMTLVALANPAFADTVGTIVDDQDDFTDKREVYLHITETTKKGLGDFAIIFICKPEVVGMSAQHGVQFHMDKTMSVTYRVDKLTPVKGLYKWNSKSNGVFILKNEEISSILGTKDKFIIKFADETTRYDFSGLGGKVAEFKTICKGVGHEL